MGEALLSREVFSMSMADGVTSVTANLAASDTTKLSAEVSQHNRNAAEVGWDDLILDVEFLTGPNRVQISRVGSDGPIEAEVVVQEWDTAGDITIQSGSMSITGTSLSVSLSAVVLAKSFVQFAHDYDQTTDFDSGFVRAMLDSTTNLEFTRGASLGTLNGHYFIVEDTGSNWDVQRVLALSMNQTSADIAITSVDMAKTMIFASQTLSTGGENPDDLAIAWLGSAVLFEIERDANAGVCTVDAFIVEWTDADTAVQRGTITMGSGTETGTQSNTAVNLDTSWVHTPMTPNGVSSGDQTVRQSGFASIAQNSSVEVEANGNDDSSIEVVRWELIEFVVPDTVVSDTVAVTDQVVVEMEYGRTVSDTIAVVDAVAREVEFEREISDAVAVVDETTGIKSIDQTISDTVAVTDLLIVEVDYVREISDTVSVVDQVAAGLDFAVVINDTISVLDQVIIDLTLGATISDTVAVTDQVIVEMEFGRVVSDAVEVTDDLCEVDQIRTAIGHFQSPTATGTVEIRNLPFQPKAVVFWGIRESSFVGAATPDSTMMLGAAADGSTSKSIAVVGEDGGSNDERLADEANAGFQLSNAGAQIVVFDVSAYVADGFDANFTTVDVSEYRIFYTAYGGDGLQAEVGQASPDDLSVTGLGFSPELIFAFTHCDTGATAFPDFGLQSFGWLETVNGGEWWVGRNQGNNGADTDEKDSVLLQTGYLGQVFQGALTWEMSFSTKDASGWSWTGTNGDAFYFLAMTLGGRRCNIGTLTAAVATDPETQVMPDLGFPRTQLLMFGSGNEVDEVATTPNGAKVSMAYVTPTGVLSVLNTDELNLEDADSQSTDQAILFGNVSATALRSGTIEHLQTPTPAITWDPNDTTNAIIIGFVAIEGCNIREVDYSRTVSDAVAVTDQVIVEMEFGRVIDDAVDLCDRFEVIFDTPSGDVYDISICDLVSVTDQVVAEIVVAELEMTISDAVAVTDQVTIEMEYGRVISDTVAVADAVAREVEFEREVSDTVAVVDQASWTFEVTINDTVEVADAIFREHDASRTINDTVAVVDQASWSFETAIGDTVSVTDQVTIEMEYGRVVSDTVAVVDAVVREVEFEREISDSVDVVDQASWSFEVVVNDTVSVTDQIAREYDAHRIISDAVATVDETMVIISEIIEVIISDSIAVTDQVVVEMEYGRTVSDAVAVVDAVAREVEFEREVSDTVTVADQASWSFEVTINDAVEVADAVFREHDASRTINDTVAVADAVQAVRSRLFDEAIGDSVAVTDQVTIEMEYGRVVSDTVAVVDAVARTATFERSVVEAVSVVDAVAREVEFERLISDAVAVVDAVAREVEFERLISDAVVVVDQVAAVSSQLFERVVSDVVAVTDQVTIEMEYGLTVSDAVAVVDQVIAERTLGGGASDTVEVTDLVIVELITIAPIDTVEVTDLLQVEVCYSRTVDDAVDVSDRVLVNDPVIGMHGIDGGLIIGPANVFTVSPTGPVTMSSGSDCDEIPAGVFDGVPSEDCKPRPVPAETAIASQWYWFDPNDHGTVTAFPSGPYSPGSAFLLSNKFEGGIGAVFVGGGVGQPLLLPAINGRLAIDATSAAGLPSQPFVGLFPATDALRASNGFTPPDFTVFGVYQPVNLPGAGFDPLLSIFGIDVSGFPFNRWMNIRIGETSSKLRLRIEQNNDAGPADVVDTPAATGVSPTSVWAYCVRRVGSDVSAWINTVQVQAPTLLSATLLEQSGNLNFNMERISSASILRNPLKIGDQIGYSTGITDTEVDNVLWYLMEKWGIKS